MTFKATAALTGLALIACLVLVGGAESAGAEEVTRQDYKAAVEPICLQNVKANERIFSGVRQEVNRGKLKPAAHRFSKAADALRSTIAELRLVPRPGDDRALLGRWLTKAGKLAGAFDLTATYLRAGNKPKAALETVRMIPIAEAANRLVVDFGFNNCHLEPSRFT